MSNDPTEASDDGLEALLNGIALPATEPPPAAGPPEPAAPAAPPTLTLHGWDDVPGKDYQPRLLRFGEAA